MADPSLIGPAIYKLISSKYPCYDGIAPSGTELPFVVYQHMGGGDDNKTGVRALNEVWQVTARAHERATADAMDSALSQALHLGAISAAGWHVVDIQREQRVRLVEVDDEGRVIYSAGAMYRLRVCEE
jgi:hypothetical protein